MNISWDITSADIQKVQKIVSDNENPFLKNRREKNVHRKDIVIDKYTIILTMIACLLTSQQRSGPNSKVGKFLNTTPFPISYEEIKKVDNIEEYTRNILNKYNLKRYINNISRYFSDNIKKIENGNWHIITTLNKLKGEDSKYEERKTADELNDYFKGFGPKQARNFLQILGLTLYEIPIDSRITNWFNKLGFPVTLTSAPLSDKGYYHFVLDGIQSLCKKAEVYPCILDAAIFSSFNSGEWTEENIRF